MNTIIILLTGICSYLYLLCVLLQNKRGRYGLIIGYFATLVVGYFIVGKPIVIFNLVFIFYDMIFGRMVEGNDDSKKATQDSIHALNKVNSATQSQTSTTTTASNVAQSTNDMTQFLSKNNKPT